MKSRIVCGLLMVLLASAVHAESLPVVDQYGQYMNEIWPGKIMTDQQLRDEAAAEWPLLKDQHRDQSRFDRFGGMIESRAYEATGRFRLEKKDGRWWFITPEGNRFFLIGVDAVGWNERGYSTPLQNNGQARAELGSLPDREAFPEAYGLGEPVKVNFLGANLKRKYGEHFDDRIDEITRFRLLAWGFNSSGKWGWGKTIGIPYFEDASIGHALRPTKSPSTLYIDMYDPEFSAKVDATAREVCARRKSDPMLIAYACENETGVSPRVMDFMLKQKSSPIKRAWFEFLAARRGNRVAAVASMLGRPDATLEELVNTPFELTMFSAQEVDEFILQSSRYYHSVLRAAYRKYDPDHLFMAAANCQFQCGPWIEGQIPYVDFVGVHSYAMDLSWFKQHQQMLRKYDRPFAVLEFSFVQNTRGMKAAGSDNTMVSEEARGLGYRFFTEHTALMPDCLGFGYFILWDQPVMGRDIGGESMNFGLISQQDQPYSRMLAEVAKSNAKLFALHDGKSEPFGLDHPRALLASTAKSQALLQTIFMPQSSCEYIDCDAGPESWFHHSQRLKINERRIPGRGDYAFGTLDLRQKNVRSVEVRAYFWDQRPDITAFLKMEQSSDNQNFRPIALKVVPGRKGTNFNEYFVSNLHDLGPDVHYVRISAHIEVPEESWALQFCGVEIK